MRIALDARAIYAPQRRGLGRCLVDLYRHLAQVRPDWTVVGYHRGGESVDAQLLPKDFVEPRHIDTPGDLFDPWTTSRLPLAVWMDGADVLHCPAELCPNWMPVPTVVTVHDLLPLDRPADHPHDLIERFRRSLRCACSRAAAMTCPSKYVRDRLIAEHNAVSNRVSILRWGCDSSEPLDASARKALRQRYGNVSRFVLHFGCRAPRNNTHRVIEAWASLPRSARRNRQLLIIGLDTWTQEKTTRAIQGLGITDSVRVHGFADESDVPQLIALAEVLVYPSLSEGFGLPILEAFAGGTAVITSDRTALPEVAGNATLKIPPEETAAIAGAMKQLLTDPSLREQCVNRGYRRLKSFAWDEAAEQFAGILEAAANAGQATRSAA